MIQTKVLSEMNGVIVYTDQGHMFGTVLEAVIQKNRVSGWKIKASQGSSLFKMLRGARGVIVPHQMVRAVGDVMIINHTAIPSVSERPQMSAMSDNLSDDDFL